MSSNLGGNFGGSGWGTTVDGIIQPFDPGGSYAQFTCFPGALIQGQTVALTLTGTMTLWDGTTMLSFDSSAGITVNSFLVLNTLSAVANVTIDIDAATTGRDITMTTGSEVETLNDGITIAAAPGHHIGGWLKPKKRKGEPEAAPEPEWSPRPADKAYLQRKKYSL